MTSGPFEPTRTLLAQQSYPGATRLETLEEVRSVNPAEGRPYTIKRVECPTCEATGRVKDHHNTNCFWDCQECDEKLKL